MAKNKKSKILASMLAVSTMAVFYAAPVMAAEVDVTSGKLTGVTTEDTFDYSFTGGTLNLDDADIVGALNDKDIFANSITVNKINGIDVVSNGTALTIGKVTLDKGHINASSALFNSDDGKVRIKNGDVVTLDSDGTTEKYSLNTVGKNTSGITIDSEGKVTTIEGAFSVDKKGHIYNANRSFQVTKDGAARFGDYNNANVRMENGVLTVNSTGETDVAKLDAQGLTLTSGATEATLSAEQIARLNTVVTQKGESIVVTADHFKNTNNSFAVDSNGAVRAANGRFNVGAKGDVVIRYAGDADDGAIVANENGFAVKKGSAQAVVTNDGVGLAAGLKADGKAAARISVTDDGIGLQGGTSEVVLNSNNGAVFTNGEGNGETVINGGSITTGTVNGVAIGMNADGDITLGDDIVIDDKFNSGNVAGITRKPLKDSALGNTTYIEENTAISADGIVVTDSVSGVSTKTKYDGFYVKDKDSNIVSSLKDDGLMLTDQESGETHTLNATDIADIKGIDRSGNDTDGHTTTIEVATSFTKDGMVTSNITTGNITTNSFTAGVTEDSSYGIDANGKMLFKSGGNYIGMDRNRIGFTSGTESVTINGEGTTFTSGDSTTRTTTSTVIKGGTITTDTLEVKNIKLGESMTDKDGNSIALGADGTLKVNNENYSLNLDGTGFKLSNASNTSSFSLGNDGFGNDGFAFAGPVNLGASDDVSYVHNGATIKLSDLTGRVEILEEKTTGISYNKDTGSTTITNTENLESSLTVGQDGTTFEGTGVGTTNINGGKVTVNGNDSTVTTIDGSEIVSDATASSTVTGGAGAGTGTVNGGYAEFDKGEGDKTIVDGGNVNVSNKITVGTGTTEITGDHVIVGVHDANKSNIGKGEATFDKGEDDKTIVNGGNVTTGNITADTGKIGNVEFTADGTTFEDGSENQTVIDKNGIVVGANDGTKIDKDDVSINDKNGGRIHLSDMGQVDNIDAELKQNDNYDDTVVGGINAEADIRRTEVARLDDRITKVEDRVDKVGAMSAAIANLRTMGYDPAAPTEIAVGIGQYRSETGVALGMFHYPNKDFMLSLSVSTSGDEVMGGIGATWKFGRKSPEKVAEIKKAQAEADARRAEEAKLAKAEEMKQAAKEAKIKAQQERHAKLAAELAAQAEAAK